MDKRTEQLVNDDEASLMEFIALATEARRKAEERGSEELTDLSTLTVPAYDMPTLQPTGRRARWLTLMAISMAAAMVAMLGLMVTLVVRTLDRPAVTTTMAAAPPEHSPTRPLLATATPLEESPAKPPVASAPPPEDSPEMRSMETAARLSASKPTPASNKRPKRRRAARPDALDELLSAALSSSHEPGASRSKQRARKPRSTAPARRRAAAATRAAARSQRPRTLSRRIIRRGMLGIKGKVQDCYDRYKVSGRAKIRLVIGRSGRVTRSSLRGTFAGSPTGKCVKRAVSRALFPRFRGKPISITYPFILS